MSSANQVHCKFCLYEAQCPKRDPELNKAKAGCKDYKYDPIIDPPPPTNLPAYPLDPNIF